MILPDYQIRTMTGLYEMINPFNEEHVNPASYDLSFGGEVVNLTTGMELTVQSIEIAPGMAILATTIEYIRMPPTLAGVMYLKSSLARLGLDHSLAGWVDPGFRGQLTMELHAHRPVILTAGQRVAQLVFHKMEARPENLYDGKYQGQTGPTKAR